MDDFSLRATDRLIGPNGIECVLGQPIRVVSGDLEGLRGIVVEESVNGRLLVRVQDGLRTD